MTIETNLTSTLKFIKEQLYDKCGLRFKNLKAHLESADYGACSFQLNGKRVEHRLSKITPTKTGQFVTLWKRNSLGKTEPFAISDGIDFVVITSKSGSKAGQFIFPVAVLAEKGIISQKDKKGKLGIRVYPCWDRPTSRQAQATQNWQTNFFVTIEQDDTTNLDRVKKIINGHSF